MTLRRKSSPGRGTVSAKALRLEQALMQPRNREVAGMTGRSKLRGVWRETEAGGGGACWCGEREHTARREGRRFYSRSCHHLGALLGLCRSAWLKAPHPAPLSMLQVSSTLAAHWNRLGAKKHPDAQAAQPPLSPSHPSCRFNWLA